MENIAQFIKGPQCAGVKIGIDLEGDILRALLTTPRGSCTTAAWATPEPATGPGAKTLESYPEPLIAAG